jgi:hypothetical protein
MAITVPMFWRRPGLTCDRRYERLRYLAGILHAGHLHHASTVALLADVNLRNNYPPLSAAEVEVIACEGEE